MDQGLELPLEQALALEGEFFAKVLHSQEASRRIDAFRTRSLAGNSPEPR